MENKKEDLVITNIRSVLANTYQKQLNNFFGDEKKALRFLSSVVWAIERTPKLKECTTESLINSFMIMAQLEFMPSSISGEAFVLPYEDKKTGKLIAQFQIGYQGIVTIIYSAGAKSVVAEIVRKGDKFSIVNGSIKHEIDPFKSKEERGELMGAYAIITTQTGGLVEKFMRKDEILAMGAKFSKSWNSEYSPWKEKNDPELWMWRKTVLKQAAKLAPKNEKLNLAISEDNKDSDIDDRIEAAKLETSGMKMGALETPKQSEGKTKDIANEKSKKGNPKEVENASEGIPTIQQGE